MCFFFCNNVLCIIFWNFRNIEGFCYFFGNFLISDELFLNFEIFSFWFHFLWNQKFNSCFVYIFANKQFLNQLMQALPGTKAPPGYLRGPAGGGWAAEKFNKVCSSNGLDGSPQGMQLQPFESPICVTGWPFTVCSCPSPLPSFFHLPSLFSSYSCSTLFGGISVVVWTTAVINWLFDNSFDNTQLLKELCMRD